MKEYTIRVHEIAVDGMPPKDEDGTLTSPGSIAFIFDGCIVSGWPLDSEDEDEGYWEANSDVGNGLKFADVTHWVEFPVALWNLAKP